MAASTVPAAKAAILSLLIARPALNEVTIGWSEPTEIEDLTTEMIFFDGPVRRTPEFLVFGADKLDETYTLTLQVRNYMPGDDRQAAEERCWELIDEIEQAVRADRTLGGILQGSRDTRDLEFDEQDVRTLPESNGFSAAGFVPLICHARI